MSKEKLLVIAEKPSAGRNFQQALGGKTGSFNGHEYAIVALRGHILAHETPEKVAYKEHKDKVGGFSHIENLPWDYKYFDFNKRVIPPQVKKYAESAIREIKSYLSKGYIPVVGSDIDALGEGDLLVHEVLDYVGYDGKIYREYHEDETPPAIQKSMRNLKDVTEQNDGHVAGHTRMVLDFLTQQVVRVATITMQNEGYRLPRPVPVGRLQSTMMNIVGQQIEDRETYKPSSEFESRYKLDELMLKNDEMERFKTLDQWDKGNLPDKSGVVEVKQTPGKTAPPKAFTLTGLGREMGKKGLSAKQTLDLAQKMYDDGVLSYPRTEDRFITPSQFEEITPKLDSILELISMPTGPFTHRVKRNTHVKTGGSHGALRPGSNMPQSIDGLDSKYGKGASNVYRAVAERFAMMYLEDTEWVRHTYETTDTDVKFTGSVKIITKSGAVDPDEDTKDQVKVLPDISKKAELYAHEIKTSKPAKPTESWLLGQLEKHEVGTSSTQLNTVGRLVGKSNKFPLKAGRRTSDPLTLSPIGSLGYQVAKKISLGQPESTRHFEKVIPLVVSKERTADDVYKEFTDTIAKDVKRIQSESFDLENLGFQKAQKRVKGEWKGEKASIPNSLYGYTFTESELETLFDGGEVSFTGKGFNNETLNTTVELGMVHYDGRDFVGFRDARYYYGNFNGTEIRFKRSYMTHSFTDDECKRLLAGENLEINVRNKSGEKMTLTGELEKQKAPNGAEFYGYKAVFPLREGYVKGKFKGKGIEFNGTFADHTFTDEELKKLLAGDVINIEFTTKKGKKMKVDGQLKKQTYEGNSYYGFKPDFSN